MRMVYFVMPAYNEEANLAPLFEAVRHAVREYRIVLVNDGSQDRTSEVAHDYSKRQPITVIDHTHNEGLGGALKTGFSYVLRNGETDSVVVTMDSDLTHDPGLVPQMIQEMEKGYDVIIASRYVPGGRQLNIPLSRRVLSRGINVIFRIMGGKVKDNTSGFRCIRMSALQKAVETYGDVFITTTEFTSTVQVLMRLLSCGARAKEIPFSLDYGLKGGFSKMKIPQTIGAYIRLLSTTKW